jgi:LPXTG-motif cell wall-anchored protein
MDDRRFDAWTRSLAAGTSRRNVLKGLFGGLVGGAAVATRLDRAGAQQTCEVAEDCTGELGPCQRWFCNQDGGGICEQRGCGDGTYCCEATGVCTPNGDCCDDSDCVGDPGPCERLVCIQDTGTCEIRGCGDGTFCCDATGTCLANGSCCVDTDCTGDVGPCERWVCVQDSGTCQLRGCGDGTFCCDATGTCLPNGSCCHNADCGECEVCIDGACYPDESCCQPFGESCGAVTIAEGGSPQRNCCDGLVCCEADSGSYCADCCGDWDCPKGSICCAGYCREIECCIDDVLIGLDPNRRCPHGCGCFEGLCVDENQQQCRACGHDKDCPHGECCCKDGTCSKHCCDRDKVCDHDKDCPHGKCCCHDGSCSDRCCKKPPQKPGQTTPPPVGGVTVEQLPATGVGDDDMNASWLGAAALSAAAAYVAGKKLREQEAPQTVPVDED